MSGMIRSAGLISLASTFLLASCATVPQADEHTLHQHDAAMAQMHGNMQKMQEQMATIHATKDSAERQRLMAEHRAAMRSQMQTMHGMMSEGACPMMASAQGKKHGGMMGKDKDQHQCPMMAHMKTMHGMMEQMMEHMSVEHGDTQDASSKKSEEHVH